MILWAVKAGWGYVVEVYGPDDKLLEHYEGGDCWTSPRVFGTGQISEDKLHELALYMCHLMAVQYEITSKPRNDEDLLK